MKLPYKLLTALAAGTLLIGTNLYAEDPKPADPAAAAAPAAGAAGDAKPTEDKESLWQQIKKGGWIMFPIAGCSIVTLYLIGDGIIRVTSPKKLLPPEQVEAVRGYFRSGKYVDAYNYCKATPTAFTNICRVTLSLLGEGKTAVEEGILAEMAKENSRMQTTISYLSVIGVCAPMIGLLGTVTGMIGAFRVLGTSGIGDPTALSAKIGEVLVATASGLFIAIPAFMAYYFLRNRATKALHDIHDIMAGLLRKMPYEKLVGAHIGGEELYAADPDWWTGEMEATDEFMMGRTP